MCVVSRDDQTDKLRQKYFLQTVFTGYKIVRRSAMGGFITTIRGSHILPGFIFARCRNNKKMTDSFRYTDRNPYGIHVYLTKKTAKIFCDRDHFIIPVKCDITQLLKADRIQAAFRVVYVEPSAFNKLTKEHGAIK